MIDKAISLASLRPKAQWVLRGDNLEWLDTEQTQPTEAEITAEVTRLQAEYDNNEYQRQRATAYPTIQEQLDMQYWDGVNGTTIWADTVASVKSENPKP
jgi:hypothetical protein